MICPDCLGEGRVEIEYTTGGVTQNGPWQGYRVQDVECETCGGWGEIDESE